MNDVPARSRAARRGHRAGVLPGVATVGGDRRVRRGPRILRGIASVARLRGITGRLDRRMRCAAIDRCIAGITDHEELSSPPQATKEDAAETANVTEPDRTNFDIR